jgi:hypothetical protein
MHLQQNAEVDKLAVHTVDELWNSGIITVLCIIMQQQVQDALVGVHT